MFEVVLPRYRLNVNEDPAYDEMIAACGGIKAIERIHAENMRYYDLARRRFDQLMREYPA